MSETDLRPQRARGLLAVAAVFVLGAVCGAALFFAGARLLHGPPRFFRHFAEREGSSPIARITRELDLDAQQQEKVRALIERSHGRIRAILEEGRKEIRDLLRPDQQEKFDRMRPPFPPHVPEGPPGPPPPAPGAPPPPAP